MGKVVLLCVWSAFWCYACLDCVANFDASYDLEYCLVNFGVSSDLKHCLANFGAFMQFGTLFGVTCICVSLI